MPLIVLLAALAVGQLPMPTFNYTTCPAASEVWSWNSTDATKVCSIIAIYADTRVGEISCNMLCVYP